MKSIRGEVSIEKRIEDTHSLLVSLKCNSLEYPQMLPRVIKKFYKCKHSTLLFMSKPNDFY